MAKKPQRPAKKPATKKKPLKTAKPTKTAKPAKKAKKTAPRRATTVVPKAPPKARNRALPGMEHVRYTDLDAYCESIATARKRKNEATQDEKGYTAGALQAMQKHECQVYKHDGIELVLVPGDAKLRVRLIKDDEGEGADLPMAPTPDADAGDVLTENDLGDGGFGLNDDGEDNE